MLKFNTKHSLSAHLEKICPTGRKIGFVPTMGALHNGHISLIEEAINNGDYVVCSIYVNPTQFNDPNDLINYPRTLEQDIALLEKANCDAVFIPSNDEIYSDKSHSVPDLGEVTQVLEGKFRPGHFNGVAMVVSILLDIVKPDRAYFGIKDYQQVMVIKQLTHQLKLKTEIIPCPIVRDSDGLALSSRNMRLTPEERKTALIIPETLKMIKKWREEGYSPDEIKKKVTDLINLSPNCRLEYIEICINGALEPATEFTAEMDYIALIACFVGNIRLIDNMLI